MGRDVEGCEVQGKREGISDAPAPTPSSHWLVVVFGEVAAGFLHNPSLSNSLSVLSLSALSLSPPGNGVLKKMSSLSLSI